MKNQTLVTVLFTVALFSSCANKDSQVEENIQMYTQVGMKFLTKEILI